jgi:hypothetical protein
VPRQRGPAAAGEQREPVIQPLGELIRGQRTQPDGRQLDGQRHSVQRPADPGHGGRAVRIELEVRPDGYRPVAQQPDRRVRLRPFAAGLRGDRQGRDGKQGLAVDAERLPAGGHDLYPRAGGQDPAGQRGRRLDDMLAVVQDQDTVAIGQRLGQPVQRGRPGITRPARDDPLADAERVQDRVRHVGRIGHRRELHEPGACSQPPGHLGGQPGLPHSAGSGKRDQAGRTEVLQHRGHLGVPADEGGQRVREHGVRGGGGRGNDVPFGIKRIFGRTDGGSCRGGRPLLAAQDAQVHPLELSRRIDAEPAGQQLAGLMVDLERLGLAARRVQGAHEQGTGAFGQRVSGQQRAELADQARSLAEGQVRLDPFGQDAGAQFGQLRRGRVGEVVPGRVGQRLTPPGRQRGPQHRGGLLRVTFGQRAAAADGQGLEGQHIDRVRPDRQPVARRVRLDQLVQARPAQFGPQPGDQRLQGVARVGGRFRRPDLVG